jgi:PAS domain S-box-containing protein
MSQVSRIELFEAALDNLTEGFAVFDLDQRVALWNRQAAALTGYAPVQLVGRPLPEALQGLLVPSSLSAPDETARCGVVHLRHENQQDVAVMAETRVLRDSLGRRIGMAVSFHATRGLDALAQDELTLSGQLRQSRADLEERLEAAMQEFTSRNEPFGLLWVSVDQGSQVMKTQGEQAFSGMMDAVERVLAQGLHPSEFIGRWQESEFLILSHERSGGQLAAHAHTLTGLARTADFRWWGDRISITVSVGSAQAQPGEDLRPLLLRARQAMEASRHAGGNHATHARGGEACLPL